MVAAVLSSACCWLPLALIGLGLGAGGVASFFEAYRTYFLAATGILLAGGFYYVYFRKPKCAPGDACAVPNRKLQRMNKIMLWAVTIVVGVFALFPNYIGYLLGASEEPSAAAAVATQRQQSSLPGDGATTAAVTRSYAIDGMTCKACSFHIQDEIAKVSGVDSAVVSYDDKTARVTFAPGAEPRDAEVIAAVAEAGYEARVQ